VTFDDPKQLLFVGGLAFLGFWLFIRANRKAQRNNAGDRVLSAEEQIERLRQSRGMHGDLEKLMAEIEDLTKRLGQRLDAKADNLERLLKQADSRIAELKRLQGETPDFSAQDTFEPPRLKLTGDAPDDPLSRSVYELADAGQTPIEIARKLNEQVGKVELILALRKA
jgi:hypothetical protein